MARRHPRTVLAGLLLVLLLGGLTAFLLPRGPANGRTVYLETEPAGAQVVLVPLDSETGSFQPEKTIRPKEKSPLTIKNVPAGEYLVVVEVAGHGFQEVYRTVPTPGQLAASTWKHQFWEDRPDGSVALPSIRIFPADVTSGMAFFEGGEFTMGAKELDLAPPHRRVVASFYLDPTEVPVGAWKKVKKDLPAQLAVLRPEDNQAVSMVTFDQAMDYAERIGKRLPDEVEYEFAATGGGKLPFPWGEDDPIKDWPLGKIGEPGFDHTLTNPPVYGLFSNVAEWTTSWPTLYPGMDPRLAQAPPQIRAKFAGTLIVRGGPYSVLQGISKVKGPDEPPLSPRWRHSVSRDSAYRGLGFRCARSARPRFLGN
jgi:formylglycine-generating enzyme required for sulfatase activity